MRWVVRCTTAYGGAEPLWLARKDRHLITNAIEPLPVTTPFRKTYATKRAASADVERRRPFMPLVRQFIVEKKTY